MSIEDKKKKILDRNKKIEEKEAARAAKAIAKAAKKTSKDIGKIDEKNRKIDEQLEELNEMAQEQSEKSKNLSNLPAKEPKGISKFFKKWGVRLGIVGSLLASIGSVNKAVEELNSQNSLDDNSKTEADNEKNDRIENKKLNDLAARTGVDLAKLGVIEKPEAEVIEDVEQESSIVADLKEQTVSEDDMAYRQAAKRIEAESVKEIPTVAKESVKTSTNANENIDNKDRIEKPEIETTVKQPANEQESVKREVETIVFNKSDNTQNSKEEETTGKTVVSIKGNDSNANISAGTVTNKEGKEEEAIIVDTKDKAGSTDVILADGNGTGADGEAKDAPTDPEEIVEGGHFKEDLSNGTVGPELSYEELLARQSQEPSTEEQIIDDDSYEK